MKTQINKQYDTDSWESDYYSEEDEESEKISPAKANHEPGLKSLLRLDTKGKVN
jgi:hypothetical protein